MDDRNGENHARVDALERIAHTLNMPAALFFAAEPPPDEGRAEAASANAMAVTQALTVMRLFLQLGDEEARARCVSFITQELLQDR